MIQRLAIVFVLVTSVSASAAPRVETESVVRSSNVSSLEERGGWGLIVGIAILGLALRRRRNGNVVTS